MFLGFVQDTIKFEVFFGIDGANDSTFDVLKLVQIYLFANGLVSLVELFEELSG